jgi:hypothetical protein
LTLDPAIFRVLVAQGATPEMLLAVIEAAAATEEERRAKKRAGNAERQARFRERNASNALRGVTERDEEAAPALDKESFPQTPFKEIKPTPSVCIAGACEADPISVSVHAKLIANRLAMGTMLALIAEAREALMLSTSVERWNAMAARTGLATAKSLTPERRKRLRARLAEHGPDAFTEAIAAIERSSFCRGDGRDGWRADFDFLLQASSFTKLIEGSYDRSLNRRSDPRGSRDYHPGGRTGAAADDVFGGGPVH